MNGGKKTEARRKSVLNYQKKMPKSIYLDPSIYRQMNFFQEDSMSNTCRNLTEEDLKNIKTKKILKYIDLFSGLGGIRIGLEQALKEFGLQGKCVFSSEIKEHALSAYNTYFKEDHCAIDITKIVAKDIPDFDILLAGFPCQAFSSAGKRLGFYDTRGTLFFDIERILKEKLPSAFILENVEGLITHDKGRTLKIILDSLRNLGYNVNYALLNGQNFGLAQFRNRVYIVGTFTSYVPLDNFEYTFSSFQDIQEYGKKTVDSFFTSQVLSHFKPEDLLGKTIKDTRGGKNNIHSWDIELKGEVTDCQKALLSKLLRERRKKHWADKIGITWMDGMPLTTKQISTFFFSDNLQEMLDDLTEKGYLVLEHPKERIGNQRKFDVTKDKGYNIVTGKLSFEFSSFQDPNDVTPTLVATDVSKIGVIDNGGIRELTIKEGLRLFGFPEDYSLSFLKKSDAFDLLGNTVCVPVIKEISKNVIYALFKTKESTDT